MRYLVKARVKSGKEKALAKAIQEGTLGQGSIAGDEYLDDMEQARLQKDGTAVWVEVCYCAAPLQEERPYWEEFFELIEIKDAHSRRNCRHENGTELMGLQQLHLHRAPTGTAPNTWRVVSGEPPCRT